MLLAGLWIGSSKPDWDVYLKKLVDEILFSEKHPFPVKSWTVSFRLIGLVADLPAKASILNMKQFNGYFGCYICLSAGERLDGRHVHPYRATFPYRTNTGYLEAVAATVDTSVAAYGIKGPCTISNILTIPEMVAIDAMHCVYIGVVKHILTTIFSSLKKPAIKKLSERHLATKVPYGVDRKPRSFSELRHFKASEYKLVLLYTGPIVLHGVIEPDFYVHFLLLSRAILLLSEVPITRSALSDASKLLHLFVRHMTDLYGAQSMGHNVHTLLHLPRHVANFGPLWCTSAASFESALHEIMKHLSGTTYSLNYIASKYLRRNVFRLKKETSKNVPSLSEVILTDEASVCLSNYRMQNVITSVPGYDHLMTPVGRISTEKYDEGNRGSSHCVRVRLDKVVAYCNIQYIIKPAEIVIIVAKELSITQQLLEGSQHDIFQHVTMDQMSRNIVVCQKTSRYLSFDLSALLNVCVYRELPAKKVIITPIIQEFDHN
jgi:hypothetical protein